MFNWVHQFDQEITGSIGANRILIAIGLILETEPIEWQIPYRTGRPSPIFKITILSLDRIKGEIVSVRYSH